MTKDSGCLEGPIDAPAIRWFQLPARLIIAFPFVHTPKTSLIRPPWQNKHPPKNPKIFWMHQIWSQKGKWAESWWVPLPWGGVSAPILAGNPWLPLMFMGLKTHEDSGCSLPPAV